MTASLPLTEPLIFCPLCHGQQFTRRHQPDICQCGACGVYFRNPRPDQSLILNSYDDGATFRQWQNELGIRAHLWEKRLSLVSAYRTSGSLLDIGTGDGYFLDFAKRLFDVKATEISKSGVEYSRARGHSVHPGTVFDAPFNTGTFDVITMWHVLEHLPMPGKVLHKVKPLLKPDGVLFIAVPNETAPLCLARASSRSNHPFGELRHGAEIHLFHFTPRTLATILRKQLGFKVLGLDVDDVHVDNRLRKLPGYYVNKLFSKLFNWHWDAAMVAVCTPRATDGTTDQ